MPSNASAIYYSTRLAYRKDRTANLILIVYIAGIEYEDVGVCSSETELSTGARPLGWGGGCEWRLSTTKRTTKPTFGCITPKKVGPSQCRVRTCYQCCSRSWFPMYNDKSSWFPILMSSVVKLSKVCHDGHEMISWCYRSDLSSENYSFCMLHDEINLRRVYPHRKIK
jgi:hypothetical protein